MANFHQGLRKRNFDQNIFSSKDRESICSSSCGRFDFLKEPNKYLTFEESTYIDHFTPKTNFPPHCKTGPIPIPLAHFGAKHFITTTQQDYGGKRAGTYTGNMISYDTKFDSLDKTQRQSAIYKEKPDEVLTTVGPVPLISTCRQLQGWETTYSRDYQYFPPKGRLFPFPQ